MYDRFGPRLLQEDGIDAISAVQESWRSLVETSALSRPFTGPGFVMAALRAYHREDRPRLLRVAQAGRTVAAMPLISRPLVRLGHVVDEWGGPFNANFILYEPVIVPDPIETRRAAAAMLLKGAFEFGADTLFLDGLPVGGGLTRLFREAAGEIGLGIDEVPARSLHYATLGDQGWAGYLATRSRNHRFNLKKVQRRAADAGAVAIEKHSGAAAIRAQLGTWFEIERRSWQGADPESAMTDRDRLFHELLIENLAEGELGNLWIVRLDSRPAAALRMLAAPGRVAVHTMHFDSEFKALAPGLLAFEAMMRDACEQGLAEVDMHGTTEFFSRWATARRDHVTLRIYRRGLRGELLRQGRRLIHRIERRGPSRTRGGSAPAAEGTRMPAPANKPA